MVGDAHSLEEAMKRLYYTLALIGSPAVVLGGTAWSSGGNIVAVAIEGR
jgi:hypothetical protein